MLPNPQNKKKKQRSAEKIKPNTKGKKKKLVVLYYGNGKAKPI